MCQKSLDPLRKNKEGRLNNGFNMFDHAAWVPVHKFRPPFGSAVLIVETKSQFTWLVCPILGTAPIAYGGVFILGLIFFLSPLASWLLGFLAFWLLGFLGFLASWHFGFLASGLLGFWASGLLGFSGFLLVYAAFGGFLAFRIFCILSFSSAGGVLALAAFCWFMRLLAALAFRILRAFWLLRPFIGFWIWLPASSASPPPHLNHHFFGHHWGGTCLDCLHSNCTPI